MRSQKNHMKKTMTSWETKKEATTNKVPVHQWINFDKDEPSSVKVSIVVPVCNVETYLDECLDSLVNQSMHEIEIICVNDGSTDHSLEKLMKYANQDARVRIIDKDNAGYGHAMNIGMDYARGEYIGIVESDDFADLHMFEDLYAIAKKEDLDFIKADFNRFVKEDGKLKCSYIDIAARAKDCYNKVIDPMEDKRVFNLVMQTWSGIYRRQFLIDHEIRHHESAGASYQDNGFWFQTMMYAKRVWFYNKPYYYNRRDNPNSSVYSKTKVYCMNKEYDFIREIMAQHPDLEQAYMFAYSRKKFLNYMFTYNRLAPEFKLEYMDVFHKELAEADEKGEIDWSQFLKKEKEDLELILKDPIAFMAKDKIKKAGENTNANLEQEVKWLKEQNEYLQNTLNACESELRWQNGFNYEMWHSTSYRLGRTLTWLPRINKDKRLKQEQYQATAKKNRICHLVMITDEGYTMPTCVALTSMRINKKLESIYKIHILASNISEDSRQKMLSLGREDFILDIINVKQDERFKNYVKRDGDKHVTPAAILKFKIPELLSKVGKVIYLDGDILVQGDLLELYNTDINGKYAAVVKDILPERNPRHMKFLKYPHRYYFNSGMMLMNLTRMRKENISQKLVDYRVHGINHFMDQDALNVVLGRKLVYVSPRYNFLNKFYEWWDVKQLSMFYGEVLPDTEKKAFEYAVVLHLGSKEKPWKYEMGYLSELYDKYYVQSPYKAEPLTRRKLEAHERI